LLPLVIKLSTLLLLAHTFAVSRLGAEFCGRRGHREGSILVEPGVVSRLQFLMRSMFVKLCGSWLVEVRAGSIIVFWYSLARPVRLLDLTVMGIFKKAGTHDGPGSGLDIS
jgi:hypothetical protein